MDLAQLEAFQAIAETESLTRAAELLHTSQPALSTMLKRFERELGAELFDRTPNRLRLNGAGALALRHINNILQDVESLRIDLRRYAERDSSLSFAFSDPGVQWYCIPRFSFAHPEIRVSGQLCGENALSLLLERNCDAAVVPGELRHRAVDCLPFLPDRVYLSVPEQSRLAQKEQISLRELPAQPILFPTFGGYFIEQIEKIIMDERPDITMVRNDFPVMQHMIRSTNFLSTVSALSMELRHDGDSRRFLPMSDPELSVQWRIVWLKANRQKLRPFLSWVKECLAAFQEPAASSPPW